MTALHTKARLAVHKDFVHECVIGAKFTSRVVAEGLAGPIRRSRRPSQDGVDHRLFERWSDHRAPSALVSSLIEKPLFIIDSGLTVRLQWRASSKVRSALF